MIRVLFTCLVFTTSSVAANNSIIEAFTVKPGLCIVEKGQACRQSFIFYWRLSNAYPACIYQGNSLRPLICVEAKKEMEKELYIALNLSDTFTLKVAQKQQSQQIHVRELGKDVRQARRHLWSVF